MTSPFYTIIGTPFSTFTRAIALRLTRKGMPFTQVRCVPHSNTAYDNHPFGFLPTLIIHGIDGKTINLMLRESIAIARYIDKVAPEPSLHISPGRGKAIIEEQMWEFVSLLSRKGSLLGKMEELMANEGYVFGSKLSLPDFFLFPLLADLKAIPEGELLSPKMLNCMEERNKMEARPP
ncbi:uncharacterized protein BJ212DRAFT_1590017 [Suillus subaureus]|uniref:GST N-terminal domain-containing protein n=1 Tax=Suillus subaureus TaxID=48587 RepID=A0A9P7E1P8_9AGAM|nr:uncharacterized protein BJ212DRAFT_1590017 [Suillus subaureus]KAG1808617.1 hypothetical protein BJ212DRAFT_1590017 [Suillus subaureus]